MKFIFDSEEQMEQFMDTITGKYCPSNFGLYESEAPCTLRSDCRTCWKNTGLETEVKHVKRV